MPCLIVLGLLFPRLVLIGLWLAQWSSRAAWYWTVLGFIFMPFTTLAYLLSVHYSGGVSGAWIIAVVVGVILDLGAHRTATKTSKPRE